MPLAWLVVLQGVVTLAVALSFWATLLQRLYGLPRSYAGLWMFGLVSYGFITLHSLWRVRSGRGVIWKGRTYVRT